jgi:hypothetical protein
MKHGSFRGLHIRQARARPDSFNHQVIKGARRLARAIVAFFGSGWCGLPAKHTASSPGPLAAGHGSVPRVVMVNSCSSMMSWPACIHLARQSSRATVAAPALSGWGYHGAYKVPPHGHARAGVNRASRPCRPTVRRGAAPVVPGPQAAQARCGGRTRCSGSFLARPYRRLRACPGRRSDRCRGGRRGRPR